MIKSFSFIVLTHFFQVNELKILRQPGYFIFKLNQQYFFIGCAQKQQEFNKCDKINKTVLLVTITLYK